jgi:hypothetical protein
MSAIKKLLIIDLFQNQEATLQDHDKYFVSVNIEGCEQMFEFDSGAGFTFIPRDKFHKLNISTLLQNSMVAFCSYTGNVFLPDGKVEVNVQCQGRTLYVTAEEYDALLGRICIRHLGISLQQIDSEQLGFSRASGVHKVNCIDDIISRD